MTREADQERRTARRLADTTRRQQQRNTREQPRTNVAGGAVGANGAQVAPVDAPKKLIR